MDSGLIVSIGFAVIILVSGIISLCKGKMEGDYSKYSQSSVRSYSKVFGVFSIIAAILFVIAFVVGVIRANEVDADEALLITQWIFNIAGLVVFVIGLALRKKYLKKN